LAGWGEAPLGLFDNPVRVFSLEELAETVRALDRERPGQTVEQLSRARTYQHRRDTSH